MFVRNKAKLKYTQLTIASFLPQNKRRKEPKPTVQYKGLQKKKQPLKTHKKARKHFSFSVEAKKSAFVESFENSEGLRGAFLQGSIKVPIGVEGQRNAPLSDRIG